MPLGGMHLPFLKLQLQHTVWDKRLNFEIPVPVPTKLRSDTEVSQMPSMVLDLAPKLHACHVTHRRHSYRHGGTQCPEIYILCLFLNIGIMGLLTIQPLPHAYRGPSRNMAIPPPSKPPACPLQQEESAADLEQIQCSNSPPRGKLFSSPVRDAACKHCHEKVQGHDLGKPARIARSERDETAETRCFLGTT